METKEFGSRILQFEKNICIYVGHKDEIDELGWIVWRRN